MGACLSANGNLFKKTKRTKGRPTFPAEASTSARAANPKSNTSRTRPRPARSSRRRITVLRDPCRDGVFRRYSFGKELGRGEFGITYQCRDNDTGETVACKTISKKKLRTAIDVEDVRREVEIMRHLPSHPNIVKYKEVYEDKEAVYIVMELCHGGELFDRIVSRGHYTERGAATITKTILEVIQVCHKHGVIHRDLKPENFLYGDASENAPLKSIDFGLSIFFKPGQRFAEIVGSPYYMAPEVLKRDYGREIDVWSAGVILYILLCGVPPFWAESEAGIAQAVVRGEINFRRDPWPRVSEDAKELVRGMLNPIPHRRMTVEQVLGHPWIRKADQVPNVCLGENVISRIKQFSLMNKFKKKVLRVVANNLPDEQIAGIKQMFSMMDTDQNGNLTFEELKDGLRKIGQPIDDPDVRMLMEAADDDGNGVLNCDEFVTMSVHLKRLSNDGEQLRQAFRYFDKNENGYIEFEELRDGLTSEETHCSNNDQMIKDIIFDVDLDKDGRISYPEFEAMMTTGVEWKMGSRQYSRAMLNALSQRLFKDK